MTEKIRILIADDHALFRSGLKALFGSVADVEVVGEAATGEEAVERAAELFPDVVLMDLQMPGMGGIEAARRVSRLGFGVVMVTMFEDDDSVFAAMRAGARGYVLKGADQAEILKVVRAAADGEALFGPAIAERLKDFFSAPRPSGPVEAFPELTAREAEVLHLIARGINNPDIARQSGHRPASPPQPEDRPQPHLERLFEAPRRRPRQCHRPRSGGRDGAWELVIRRLLDPISSRDYTLGMDYRDIITIEPGKRGGKPTIRGMRITVQDVLEYLAGGMSEDELLSDFPELTRADIRACLAFAADRERKLMTAPPL